MLIEGIDADGCPKGLTLADFGLSAKIGENMGDWAWIWGCLFWVFDFFWLQHFVLFEGNSLCTA